MNYELAKKLKDAGFPQTDLSKKKYIPNPDFGGKPVEGAYIPTLSELIEACMEKDFFHSLTYLGEGEWEAEHGGIEPVGIGNTPEEAVTNLWLKLHENIR